MWDEVRRTLLSVFEKFACGRNLPNSYGCFRRREYRNSDFLSSQGCVYFEFSSPSSSSSFFLRQLLSSISLEIVQTMASTQIFPITQHPSSSSSSSSSPTISATVDTMLIKGDGTKDEKQNPFLLRWASQATAADERTLLDRRHLLGHNVGHAVRLCFKVLRYLWKGYKWIARFLSLGFYVVFIFPGFLQVAYYYLFSSQIRRSIKYGDQPRNRLDIYLPKTMDGQKPKPVVAFVTGGAWIIGNKAWGSLLGSQLSERDIIVACIDYRNFPQGTISDMVKDTSQGISFLFNNIVEYGGDPNRIYLMGQSAGAHIAACTLVEQAIKEAGGEKVSWSASRLKAYFGLSGGYNLLNLKDYFHSRGLHRSIFLSIMEGEESLQKFSPEVRVQDPKIKDAVSLLPRLTLFHGTADYSIPSDASQSFAEVLERVGVKVEAVLYKGKTHTDLFVQDPMRGGKDQLVEDLIFIIHEKDRDALARDAMAPLRKRLVPELLLKLAHSVSPF